MSNEKLLGAIKTNAERRRTAEEKLRELREQADELIVQADEAGVPKLRIAQVARMTRQTIYTILLRAKAAA